MEEELQELRDLIAQLKADSERLLQRQNPVHPFPASATVALTERLVFIPRDRKCPMFRGRSVIALGEWVKEVQAFTQTRHLSVPEQAFFLFYDHLEGEGRKEIKYRMRRRSLIVLKTAGGGNFIGIFSRSNESYGQGKATYTVQNLQCRLTNARLLC